MVLSSKVILSSESEKPTYKVQLFQILTWAGLKKSNGFLRFYCKKKKKKRFKQNIFPQAKNSCETFLETPIGWFNALCNIQSKLLSSKVFANYFSTDVLWTFHGELIFKQNVFRHAKRSCETFLEMPIRWSNALFYAQSRLLFSKVFANYTQSGSIRDDAKSH